MCSPSKDSLPVGCMLCLALPRGDDGAPILLFREELIGRGWFIQHGKAELLLRYNPWVSTGTSRMVEMPDFAGLTRPETDAAWMRLALEQARLAGELGEVPVGALVIKDQEIIGRGHNRNLLDHDPSTHAEIVALRQAAATLGNHRLPGCEIFVTIEPCAMCAGALVHARLSRVIYGASDPKAGAVMSVLQVLNHPGLNHKMEVVSGVLAQECSELLQTFFRQKRKQQSAEIA